MQFLLLAPIVLYFFSAAAILLIRRMRSGVGYSWMLAVLTALAGWAILLYFRFNQPPAVILLNWLPVNGVLGTVILQLDTAAWVYTFSLAGMVTSVLLTSSARLQYRSNPATWAANLAITAAGMVAMMAGTPLTLALAWTMIDVIELAFVLAAVQEKEISRQTVVAFSTRVAATLVLMGTMALSKARGQELLLIAPLPELSIFLLIAAGLRLGVLPLHLPYLRELPFRRGVSTTLRMTAAASGLVILGRIPITAVSPDWYPWLLLFSGLAAFYGAAMWLASANEIQGRPYWMIALAGLAVASVIRSYPEASLAWGAVLILSGSVIFLFSVRERSLIYLPALGVLSLSGLPFTPAGVGWRGLVVLPINFPDFIFILAHAALVLGYLRHMIQPGDHLAPLERWIHTAYPVGLLFSIGTAWLAAFFGLGGNFGLDRWWASLVANAIAAAGFVGWIRLQPWWRAHPERTRWVGVVGQPVMAVLNRVLRLDWLYNFLGMVYRVIQRLIAGLTMLLEGDGGMLWAFVLLALLASLLQTFLARVP